MRRAAAIAIVSCLPLSAVMADVYKSVDGQGHVLYSDTPTPGAELVKVSNPNQRGFAPAPSSPARSSTTTGNSNAANSTTALAKSNDQIKEQLAHEEAARSVANDLAASRAEQCKKAQDVYEKSIIARRIYNEDKNGDRQYLSDTDADQARVNAKLAMDEVCKG
jgi:hypothetical protein